MHVSSSPVGGEAARRLRPESASAPVEATPAAATHARSRSCRPPAASSPDCSYAVSSRALMRASRTSAASARVPLALCPSHREHRQQLVAVTYRPCALGCHQVAEQLAHHAFAPGADAAERGLGVLRECAAHAADLPGTPRRVRTPRSLSRCSHSREVAKARSGRAPRSRLTAATISSTSASSSNW